MPRFTHPVAVLGCLLLVAAACRPQSSELSSNQCRYDREVEIQIADAWRVHEEGHLASNPVAAASIYPDDVWFRWDGGRDSRSRAMMEDFYRRIYSNSRIVDIAYTSDEIIVCGDAAHEVGHYYVTSDVEGQRSTLREHYMHLWRLQPDGSWKLSRGAGSALPEES